MTSSDIWVPGQVDTIEMFDAAFCPDPVPAGFPACMVYAGGSSAYRQPTPTNPLGGWDQAEIARVAHLYKLPVWVPTPGTDNPRQAALGFVNWLTVKNVPALAPGGEHTLVLSDLETGRLPDPIWVNAFCDVMKAHGYYNLVYGSTGTLFGQPARSGYFPADPTRVPHLYQHPQVVGTQYAFNVRTAGGVIDRSLFRRDLADQLWQPS